MAAKYSQYNYIENTLYFYFLQYHTTSFWASNLFLPLSCLSVHKNVLYPAEPLSAMFNQELSIDVHVFSTFYACEYKIDLRWIRSAMIILEAEF